MKYFYFFINIILKILYFFPKDKNIWIFGAWHGYRYSDNSRYFYEYLKEIDYKKVRLIWITKNKALLKFL